MTPAENSLTADDFGFGFLDGQWTVRNRRLADHLDPDSGWEEFDGHTTGRLFWDGRAHVDEIAFPSKGFRGLTLRLYEPETGEWTLNWSNSTTGRLYPPVRGRFAEDGTGEFQGLDTYDGQDVRVRFRWSGISSTTARWEQAFAPVGSEDWVTNWVMEFSRA
ncbi:MULTISPECIES: hypothetical protein [Streptomyces]|uniref:DUF1579 domain-containing protein n=1 Tax=Streptomyces lateritius TaxID=67313 RepID=A0ABW6YDX7_9ACTN|nr:MULTISPECIES: hypothetical protein [Streptomyces]QGZ51812.1 hypothetical protein GPZ77_28585 [Streptomyces sp. QHH-9511]GGT96077.1 hypothetical protein GCM10010272_46090 [Streptomyces lateritius]